MKKFALEKSNITVPNALSFLRILILIPFVIFVMKDNYVMGGIILIISGISDMLDGITARKFNQITELGKMLDPTADKLTLMAVMICVSIKFPRIFPFMVILIAKEIAMLIAGIILLKNKKVPPSSQWYGKVSTVVFYISVITIIAFKAVWNLDIEIMNIFLMSLTAVCMFYSVCRYFKIFMLLMENDKNTA